MARPIRSATRLRTMRTRNSPRCSMNDILSGAIGLILLPPLDEVPQGADAPAGREALADGGRHVRLTLDDRITQRPPTSESGGDSGGVGAAGAVRVRRVELGTGCTYSRSEEHTSELQSRSDLVCRLLLEKK